MKQILLAAALIAVPVIGFTGFHMMQSAAVASTAAATSVNAVAALGDMSAMITIIGDVQKIAGTGDMVAAETRITDFETAWDDAAPTLQPKSSEEWGIVDQAADHALKALRAKTLDPATVTTTLNALMDALQGKLAANTASGGPILVSGIAVTDANGNNIPCESLIKAVRADVASGKISAADATSANDLLVKATERCNADDDVHADQFSAQALAMSAK